MINNKEFINDLISELRDNQNNESSIYAKDIKIFKQQLQKLYDKRTKLDDDYFNDDIETTTYNRLMNALQERINEVEHNLRSLESKLDSHNIELDEESIIYTLKNFNKLFDQADGKEKKLLIRSLIKEIHVEENRKDIKKITFWFSSVDVLPSIKTRRTVS
ncbi:hypothetical protein [Sediminibacillus dalangtanensis]|uniref:hypothetical protein n=1 Tax=Sediminibacillus dalangtanensis TaxID=2729421 RepID=UPI001FD87074|nr:hypothetical protein [Sediminibacillus dalangtanensis]